MSYTPYETSEVDEDFVEDITAGIVRTTPKEPWRFRQNPAGEGYDFDTNSYVGSPFLYWESVDSWIFFNVSTEPPGPPADPENGNLWINVKNRDNTDGLYLMYVYNDYEMDDYGRDPESWYALTDNKRAYDYMVVPTVTSDAELPLAQNTTIIGNTPVEYEIDIFKQAYLYFNSQDMDLKVLVPRPDDTAAWASVTQLSLDLINDPDLTVNDLVPPSSVRQLKRSINSLDDKIAKLKNDINNLP